MPSNDNAKKMTVKLVKSPIGYSEKQRRVVQSLGLGKMNTTATHSDSPTIRGMIHAVRHLVAVSEA